jgi:hypothetical protein
MAWGIHTQADCHFGKKIQKFQKAQANAAITTTTAAAPPANTKSTSAYEALLANMARCAADE